MRAPPLAAWCGRWRFYTMSKKPNQARAVVTVLAIVWYVLEIVIKTVQLLRGCTRDKALPG